LSMGRMDVPLGRFCAGGSYLPTYHWLVPAPCTRLPSWEDLRTGDILIAPGRHVLLFIQWEGTEKNRFLGSEAGPLPAWKCSEHVFSRAMLENSGYRPMRYRGMRD